jgi:hypothetical protein
MDFYLESETRDVYRIGILGKRREGNGPLPDGIY